MKNFKVGDEVTIKAKIAGLKLNHKGIITDINGGCHLVLPKGRKRSEEVELYYNEIKKVRMMNKKEGFWYSKYEPNLPRPKQMKETSEWVSKGRSRKFSILLSRVERKAICKGSKGSSICRICKKRNGSCTFFYKNWEWPDGLIHYIKDHNVKPSKEFIRFIEINS